MVLVRIVECHWVKCHAKAKSDKIQCFLKYHMIFSIVKVSTF